MIIFFYYTNNKSTININNTNKYFSMIKIYNQIFELYIILKWNAYTPIIVKIKCRYIMHYGSRTK